VCAHFEGHRPPGKEQLDPVTYVREEAFEAEDLCGTIGIDCVEEASDVKKKEGSCMPREARSLDMVD